MDIFFFPRRNFRADSKKTRTQAEFVNAGMKGDESLTSSVSRLQNNQGVNLSYVERLETFYALII